MSYKKILRFDEPLRGTFKEKQRGKGVRSVVHLSHSRGYGRKEEEKLFFLNWQLFMWSLDFLYLFFIIWFFDNKYILHFCFYRILMKCFCKFLSHPFSTWECVCVCALVMKIYDFLSFITVSRIRRHRYEFSDSTSEIMEAHQVNFEGVQEDDGIYNELNSCLLINAVGLNIVPFLLVEDKWIGSHTLNIKCILDICTNVSNARPTTTPVVGNGKINIIIIIFTFALENYKCNDINISRVKVKKKGFTVLWSALALNWNRGGLCVCVCVFCEQMRNKLSGIE